MITSLEIKNILFEIDQVRNNKQALSYSSVLYLGEKQRMELYSLGDQNYFDHFNQTFRGYNIIWVLEPDYCRFIY